MSNQIREQNKIESETTAYKMFMRVAKKLRFLEYGKWKIVPDLNEPLRKFTIEKDIDWGQVKLCLYHEEYRKRAGNYTNWEDRVAYRYRIGVKGLFNNHQGAHNEVIVRSGMQLKPRMVKKLLEHVNTRIIPEYYQVIENERIEFESTIENNKVFKSNMDTLKGLVSTEQSKWNLNSRIVRPLNGGDWPGVITSNIRLDKDDISFDMRVPYALGKKLLEVLNNG